jgi:thiopeptide-type bacteriocin biosynthesis protein
MPGPCEDFFVLRTPLLPLDDFLAWTKRAGDASDGDEEIRRRLRQDLARRLDVPEAREALFVASPSLWATVEVWRASPSSKQGRQIERALVRYFSRMTSRPTPFGLCAGVSVGTLGDRTDLRLGPRERYTRAMALDGAVLARLHARAMHHETLGPSTRLCVNPSLFVHDGRIRYIEANRVGGRRQLDLAEVEVSPHIAWVLQVAREGSRVQDIIDRLRGHDPEVTAEEAMEFVEGLIEHQLLHPADALRVTGPPSLEGLLDDLARDEAADRDLVATLERVHAQLSDLERQPLGVESSSYRAAGEPLGLLAAPLPSGHVFKIDLYKPLLVGTLDATVRDELVEAARVLARLADAPADPLVRFRADFRRRYQERWVPLLEALDPDVGVGFDLWGLTSSLRTPLLDGLPFPKPRPESLPWRTKKHGWLLERLLRGGAREDLVLSDADVEVIALRDDPRLPPAYHIIASLLPPGMPGGAALWLRSGGGPSGANLMGRFCHGSRPLEAAVRRHLAREAELYAPAVVAEIVHLPDERLLNVVGRPVLREHEIPVLGRSGAEPDQQIHLDDLWLRLADDRVVLASRRLGKEVIVRLTSAHNHWSARNVGMYSFLCALQGQGMTTAFGWDWGPLADLPRLPRVRWRRIVVSPARWRIDPSELPRESASPADRSSALARLRVHHELPRLLLLVQDDQELLVDLDNPLSVDSLLHAVDTAGQAVLLSELLPPVSEADVSAARGPEGQFVHELVIPVDGRLAPRPMIDASRIGADEGVPRVFTPHGEWDTWRLYAAPGLVERALVEDLLPWLERRAPHDHGLDWYFLRHGDPQWHLCLRFGGVDAQAVDVFRAELAALGRSLVSRGRLWTIRTDTYVREIERYGGPQGIAACERIFVADSRFCAAVIVAVARAEDESLRWKVALWSIDRMLEAFELDETRRLELVESLRHNFGEELGANDSPLAHALGRRFRALRAQVEPLFAVGADAIDPVLVGANHRFVEQVRPEVARLYALEESGALPERCSTIVRSLLHMRINRLMLEEARKHELALYDLLARAYRARLARRG